MNMQHWMKNRLLAGNICLVVFSALILSFFIGPMGGMGSNLAEAATVNTIDPNFVGTPQVTITPGSTSNEYNVTVTINVKPITAADYTTVPVDLGQIGSASNYVYGPQTIMNVAYSVYHYLLNLTYQIPATYTAVYQLLSVGSVVYDTYARQTVYLKVTLKPPETSGGGTAPVEIITVTPDGTLITNTSTDSATLTADASIALQKLDQLPAEKPLEITVPASVTASEKGVSLPLTVVEKATEKGKEVKLNLGAVTIEVPAGALEVKGVEDAKKTGAPVSVKIAVRQLSEGETDRMVSQTPAEALVDLKVAGTVYRLNAAVLAGQSASEVKQFNNSLQVALPYDPKKVEPGEVDKLGAYRRNDDGKGWTYVRGSKVDKAANVVRVSLKGFSDYLVMAYNKTFSDLDDHWARTDIELMAAKHIARGMPDGIFVPGDAVTRAQFAAFLERALNFGELQPATGTFKDVPADKWYYAAVEGAAKAGIVLGDGHGNFRPNDPITRQEMAAMVIRARKYAGKFDELTEAEIDSVLAQFADAPQISGWAKAVAAQAVKAGIIKGRPEGFAPIAKASRAEALVMIKRLLGDIGAL